MRCRLGQSCDEMQEGAQHASWVRQRWWNARPETVAAERICWKRDAVDSILAAIENILRSDEQLFRLRLYDNIRVLIGRSTGCGIKHKMPLWHGLIKHKRFVSTKIYAYQTKFHDSMVKAAFVTMIFIGCCEVPRHISLVSGFDFLWNSIEINRHGGGRLCFTTLDSHKPSIRVTKKVTFQNL